MKCLIKSKHEVFKFNDLRNMFLKVFPKNYDSKIDNSFNYDVSKL